MLSKNRIKQIRSLSEKKFRDDSGLFMVEGEKAIAELMSARYRFNLMIAVEEKMPFYASLSCEKIAATPDEIKRISLLKTPPSVFALCHKKEATIDVSKLHTGLVLALDQIQDPGNLGTIIRLASWFGLRQLVCSPDTVDCYNPKVVQASMGAIAHVNIHYHDLVKFISDAKKEGIPVYGTFPDGRNIYQQKLTNEGIIVLGNEGKGISSEIEQLIDLKLMIPSHPLNQLSVESLNVSVAAAIVCSEFRRNSFA